MAVFINTSEPSALLNAFNDRIAQDEPKGKITTWERSADGVYYTHKAQNWHSKAWFMPVIEKGVLKFNIIKPANADVTDVVYSYYHGHLTETFLNHFDRSFSDATSSALPRSGDVLSKPQG